MFKNIPKNLIVGMVIVTVLILISVFGLLYFGDKNLSSNSKDQNNTTGLFNQMDVQEYVKDHISELSPVKEQVGGKFFVTNITGEKTADGSIIFGEVEYEDGHNAYKASYTFFINEDNSFYLQSFELL